VATAVDAPVATAVEADVDTTVGASVGETVGDAEGEKVAPSASTVKEPELGWQELSAPPPMPYPTIFHETSTSQVPPQAKGE
jgi:hypothetical protein